MAQPRRAENGAYTVLSVDGGRRSASLASPPIISAPSIGQMTRADTRGNVSLEPNPKQIRVAYLFGGEQKAQAVQPQNTFGTVGVGGLRPPRWMALSMDNLTLLSFRSSPSNKRCANTGDIGVDQQLGALDVHLGTDIGGLKVLLTDWADASGSTHANLGAPVSEIRLLSKTWNKWVCSATPIMNTDSDLVNLASWVSYKGAVRAFIADYVLRRTIEQEAPR